MKNNILKVIGLSDHEISVYTALLTTDIEFVSDIERKAKLHRPQVYKALKSLEEKGLIFTKTKGKRKAYVAVSPEKLSLMFNKIEKEFFNNLEDLHENFRISKESKPILTIAEGKEAIHDSYHDIARTLKKNDKYYRYMGSVELHREKYVPKGYYQTRDKKGLERSILTSSAAFKNTKKLGREVKMIPPEIDLFEYGLGQVIYGKKVSIIDYDSETVITIKHKKFAEFQKQIFKLLFSKL